MSLGPCLGAHPLWSHARFFASESRVTIFKIIIRLGFTFKKFLKLKFYRGIIFHGSSDKNQQKPRRAGGLGTHPINFVLIVIYIDSLVIYVPWRYI